MIEEVTMYGMSCDGCDSYIGNEDYDYLVMPTERDIIQEARDAEWREIDGKWYCLDCQERLFEYDEDKDIWVKKEQG